MSESEDRLAELILDLFFVRKDAYGIEDENGWRTMKAPVTKILVKQHLRGGPCLGAHVTSAENQCRWMGWDTDEARLMFVIYERAVKRYPRSAVLFNRTGGRGYHVRVFFERLVPSSLAYRLAYELVKDLKGVEFFPKQPSISEVGFGHFMRLPLGKHGKTGQVGLFLQPRSLFDLQPCAPRLPQEPTFDDISFLCSHRILDNLGYWNCLASNGTVGLCTKENCSRVEQA